MIALTVEGWRRPRAGFNEKGVRPTRRPTQLALLLDENHHSLSYYTFFFFSSEIPFLVESTSGLETTFREHTAMR